MNPHSPHEIAEGFDLIATVEKKPDANARLIASAPELLAMLKQCLPIIDAYRAISGGEGDSTANTARAIIERIEG